MALSINNFGNYSARTKHNCKNATLTIAIAVDFSTAGERLTKNQSKDKYFAVPIDDLNLAKAKELVVYAKLLLDRPKLFSKDNTFSVHFAGNGIYTFDKHEYSQEDVDKKSLKILKYLHKHVPIQKLYSGAQTGADLAGVRAAFDLGIPEIEVNYPKGYQIRNTHGEDIYLSLLQATTRLCTKDY